jgi:hypothetical protein
MKTSSLNKKRITLLILFLILLPVLLCVALSIFGPRLGRIIHQTLWKNDSTKAAEIAHTMVDYTLPTGYREKSYIQVLETNSVLIVPADGSSAMTIQFMQESISMSDQETVTAMEDAWAKEVGDHTYQTKRVSTEMINLLGVDTTLSYRDGKDETGQAVRQLITVFYGKTGWTVLVMVSPLENWDQNLVDEFIQSIN